MTTGFAPIDTTYYEGGFRKMTGGVPCRVASRRTRDGRYVRAETSPHYDAVFDSTKGVSRLEKNPAVVAAAREALAAAPVRKPRVVKARPIATPVVEAVEPVEIAQEAAPVVISAPISDPVAEAPALPVAAIPADVTALVAALEARIAALETSRGYSAPPAPANDAVAPVRRSERQAAAIRRAWSMRKAMRERADLDGRALFAANGAYRGSLDALQHRTAELVQVRAQLAAAETRADAAERRVSAQDRDAAGLRAELRAAQGRAERLVTIATGKRRAAASDRAALDRVRADLAGAQAETRAVQRRYATIRDALAASPVAAAVVAKRTPAVLEA